MEQFAAEVVAALRDQGLQPQWDGSAETRIFGPLTWQRRRAGRLAAYPGSITAPDFRITAEPIDWDGPRMAGGQDSAGAWATLRLPWLPTGAKVRLTVDGRTQVVHREWNDLVDDQGRRVGRHDAWTLLAQPSSTAAATRTTEPSMLNVQYAQRDLSSNGHEVPMTVDECRWLLRTAPVYPDGNTIYASRSGQVMQHIWRTGGELWLEYLDPSAQLSHGRVATPAEVERVIAALADEDRIILRDLGPLETVGW